MDTNTRYVQPGWFTRQVANRLVRRLARMGVTIRGSRELRVRGRATGEWRSTVVNLLDFEGRQFLVAPRGTTQWVRNLRAAGTGELRAGRHHQPFRGVEVRDEDKVPVLRAYLERWKAEVGIFFDGIGPDAPDEAVARIAPGYPVFLIEPEMSQP
jgi:deazaflavin-dependent oxidoreductase (nitroreductase family)